MRFYALLSKKERKRKKKKEREQLLGKIMSLKEMFICVIVFNEFEWKDKYKKRKKFILFLMVLVNNYIFKLLHCNQILQHYELIYSLWQ